MNPSRRIAVIAPVAIVLALGATSAFAGTTGTEFQTMYTTLLNWATGYLGKAIAVAGRSFLAAASSAARCTADGNTSLELCPMFTWSFG